MLFAVLGVVFTVLSVVPLHAFFFTNYWDATITVSTNQVQRLNIGYLLSGSVVKVVVWVSSDDQYKDVDLAIANSETIVQPVKIDGSYERIFTAQKNDYYYLEINNHYGHWFFSPSQKTIFCQVYLYPWAPIFRYAGITLLVGGILLSIALTVIREVRKPKPKEKLEASVEGAPKLRPPPPDA